MQYSDINCILYIPSDRIIISGSNTDKILKSWEFQENNIDNTDNLLHVVQIYFYCLN